ncbi:hypothetical protein E3T37_12795 [Cryobacterium sp. TMT2-10]|uniref:hypothetical protein n=1 Tax=Cryobacterium sp. TMT2-10 TaxID=1259244 RepID=UPI0010690029|nr:hypothetical protein [Cryobacterium sp. TMT2-10]TFD37066.1 hypothetical protein E3T37_12795 [Cryobacterium sp. TMT2-10]
MSQPFEIRTRSRVPGPSMWRLIVVAMLFVGVVLVVMVVAILSIVVTHDTTVAGILFLVMVAVSLVCFLLLSWMSKQMKREFAAGYTTSRMGYPNLEQVDESTGLVVRAAGEPLLSRQVRRDRVLAYKATRAGSRES